MPNILTALKAEKSSLEKQLAKINKAILALDDSADVKVAPKNRATVTHAKKAARKSSRPNGRKATILDYAKGLTQPMAIREFVRYIAPYAKAAERNRWSVAVYNAKLAKGGIVYPIGQLPATDARTES